MKFRAVFRDPHILFEVCENIQNMQKYALLKLCMGKIRLSATSATMDGRGRTSNDRRVCVWVSIPAEDLFVSMHIESKRKNEIFCLLKTADIVSALRQASTSTRNSPGLDENPLSIKLSKDGSQPILLFTMTTADQNIRKSALPVGSITHSIPVQVIGDEGPELAQLPSITQCVRSFVVPSPNVISAFCGSCQSSEERPSQIAESKLSSGHRQGDTVLMKIEKSNENETECKLSFFCGETSSSQRCVFYNVQLVSSNHNEPGEFLFPDTEQTSLYFEMKSVRLGTVMRVLCKNKRAHKTKSIFHCTKSSGIICSTNLAGSSTALYHIPCIPTLEC